MPAVNTAAWRMQPQPRGAHGFCFNMQQAVDMGTLKTCCAPGSTCSVLTSTDFMENSHLKTAREESRGWEHGGTPIPAAKGFIQPPCSEGEG